MMMLVSPAATASSMTYWMIGLSTMGSISLGWALVAGRKRVPRPAAGNTALRTGLLMGGGGAGVRATGNYTGAVACAARYLERVIAKTRCSAIEPSCAGRCWTPA